MKTKNKPTKHAHVLRPLITIIVISAVIALCSYFIWQYKFNQPKPINNTDINHTIDLNPPTNDQKAAGEAQKNETSNPTNNELGISITTIDTSNNPVQIRSVISGAISNSGTCTLNLTKNGTTITKTAETYAMPSSSTCNGFEINKNELSSGEWQIKLTVNIEGKESSITDSFSLE